MKIDINKKYVTKKGFPVEILKINCKSDKPIVGVIYDTKNDIDLVCSWHENGKYNKHNDYYSEHDLEEVVRTYWINIYVPNYSLKNGAIGHCYFYKTKEKAEAFTDENCRLACVEVKIPD